MLQNLLSAAVVIGALRSKEIEMYTTRVSNNFDPDQARHIVWADLGPNCLQMLLTNYNSFQKRVVSITA